MRSALYWCAGNCTIYDAGALATEAGIRHLVALSAALWDDIRTIPAGREHESADGRLWDLLWMFHCAARRSPPSCREFVYTFLLTRIPVDDLDDSGDEAAMTRHEYRVLAICGPGDQDEPVITLFRKQEKQEGE